MAQGSVQRQRQRGAGSIGCLLLLVLVGGGAYAGYQIGIPRVRHSSFGERINESLTNLRPRPAEEVQKQVVQIARDFDIELKPEQVRVTNEGGKLTIDLSYQKVIDLKFWQKTETFNLRRSGTE